MECNGACEVGLALNEFEKKKYISEKPEVFFLISIMHQSGLIFCVHDSRMNVKAAGTYVGRKPTVVW